MPGRTPFLRQVAGIYLEKEGDRLQECCFVFPNRRSSLFFRKYMAQECAGPLFCPPLTTVSDLFSSMSGLRPADDMTLLYELWSACGCRVPEFRDTFDDFLRYGDVMLRDFDDIDKYMADAPGIFRNLCDLRKLDDTGYEYLSDRQREAIREFWSTVKVGRRNSDMFLGTWQWLLPVYEEFRRTLERKGMGYPGMIQRSVAETVQGCVAGIKYRRVVFIGFNALNVCESVLMDALRKEGKGDFYWDYPGSILKDRDNRASHFMQENLSRYPSVYPLEEEADSVPEITVIGVPSAVGQAKALPRIVEELGGGAAMGELSTCVVLPDSSLLHPVLNSIPESIGTVNVTMGYPLKESSVAFFMSLVAQLQMKRQPKGFYHAPVEALLVHPFLRRLTPSAGKMREMILKGNLVYVPYSSVDGDPVLKTVFSPVEQSSLPDYLLGVLELLRRCSCDLDREYIYHYGVCIRRLEALRLEVRIDTWFSILSRLVSGISIPLSGEPLSGLQIMGPLETMALDFRNIVIMSMNEGVFPSRSMRDSMIPYNLRRGFGLPTYEVQDAIAAYHFYRSLARAVKVYFLYDTRTGGAGSSEVSRYVLQLKYHHRLPVRELSAVYPLTRSDSGSTVDPMPKNEETVAKLGTLNWSASSLLTYLNCPLQFFYSAVCGFSVENEVEDSVDAGTFGDLFHKTMELLHSPYVRGTVDAAAVKFMKNGCRRAVAGAFKCVLGLDDISGRNVIVAELIVRYVLKALEREDADAPFRYLASELPLAGEITTPSRHRLRIYGKVDRYDCVNGTYRIMDYKTGKHIFMKYDSVDDLFRADGCAAKTSFQLLFYLFLMRQCRQEGADTQVVMEVLHTNELFSGGRHVMCVPEQEYEVFSGHLLSLLDEIMNPDIPFQATAVEDNCVWCPFKILCGR